VTSPFGPLVVIANPKSGHGKAAAQLSGIAGILRSAGLDYRIVETARPGHATEVARAALAAGERYLVAVGGDGTIHEVVNGMLEDDRPIATDAVLGVVPAGSGCDFVKSVGLPGDAVRAARHLSGSDVRALDVGKVTFGAGTTRYFLNIAEIGLGGSVVDRAAGLTRWPGPARYFIGFWLTLPRFRPATVRLEADGQAFGSRAYNVVVANCRYYGGGMHISPKSAPEDGLLDVLVMVGPKSDAFVLLPKVYRGKHLPHRHIVEMRASRIRVEPDAPLTIEADGEVLGTAPATFEVIQTPIRIKV
jgi:diacylglycerol kinase (ATP)